MYQAVTQDIRISVESFFLEEQSSPDMGRYVWAYQVHIENTGQETVQLINRYWHITDAHGAIQEVRGAGVVGENYPRKSGRNGPSPAAASSNTSVLETPPIPRWLHGSRAVVGRSRRYPPGPQCCDCRPPPLRA